MAYYKETAYYSAANRFEVGASSITKISYLTTLPQVLYQKLRPGTLLLLQDLAHNFGNFAILNA